MKKQTMAGLALAAMAAAFNAQAHGPAPARHGGIVQSAGDLSFELVAAADAATLYVVDHEEPADTSGFGGKLTVLNGNAKSEAALKPVGANGLQAAPLALGPGAKAVAVVTTAAGKTITLRFTLK